MVTKAEAEKALRLISQAWGRKQRGYVFFPYIDREKQRRLGKRRAGFSEGPAFRWPADRERIVDHMMAHAQHDLYWSTSLFEYPMRREDVAMDEHALWADLDEADPRLIDDEYRPTIAWESSPGRYQALWVAASGDFQGASWPGNENQRLTYMVGADPSGWDTVQLLRVPGFHNHKPEYRQEDGSYPQGKILWYDGPKYLPSDFANLPEVQGQNTDLTDALEADIEAVDRLQVIADVRLKLNHRARELLAAREASGDKSDQLWYLIRCLADAGLSTAEIVAVVRESVWNKFRDRHDELRRLITEASKAIAKRSDETLMKLESESEEEGVERASPQRLGFLLKNIKRPKYLIQGVLTEGACGFIAGEPKCYKSWVGLDLAMSIATGADFLGHFRVQNPGPVLYIQEEDPPTTLKNRSAKIWVNKSTDKFELIQSDTESPGLYWLPPEQDEVFDPQINAYIQQGLVLSNEAWQLWLDETLAQGMDGEPYRLIIIDTLMMTAGEVDENRSQEMTTKIFKPLKTLSRKHNVAVLVIHHMGKSDKARPGQRMLGAVANHAWAEDSLYLSRSGLHDIRIDLESKTVPSATYRMGGLNNQWWTPEVSPWRPDDEQHVNPDNVVQRTRAGSSNTGGRRKGNATQTKVLESLKEQPTGMTTSQVADLLGVTRSSAHKVMTRLLEADKIERTQLANGSNIWNIPK